MDAATDAVDAVAERRSALHEYKRQWIRDAAKEVFARDGIDGTSMREIARAAGYTVGVLYHYFRSKEELYAEVLEESLRALVTALDGAASRARRGRSFAAAVRELYAFYRRSPADFDLSFYLYGGARPVGLAVELDRRLNALVAEAMACLARALLTDGAAEPATARRRAVNASTYVFGLVLMAHTGRLRSLGEDPEALLTLYLDEQRRTST